MNFDPNTKQPMETPVEYAYIPYPEQPFTQAPPVTPEPPQRKKWLIPVIIGSIVLILAAITLIILLASGAFLKPAEKIALAAANTFNEHSDDAKKVAETMEEIRKGDFTAYILMEMDSGDIELETRSNEETTQTYLAIDVPSLPTLDMVMDISAGQLRAQIPFLTDTVFVYNYEEENEGYLRDMMGVETLKMMDITLQCIENTRPGQSISFETIKTLPEAEVLKDLFYSLEFEKAEKQEFTVNGNIVNCKGYRTVITEDYVMDVIDAYEDICMALVEESDMQGMEAAEEIEVTFDEIRYSFKGMVDTDMAFYLYDGMLAAIILDSDYETAEFFFQGGDFRLQNVLITYDGEEIMALEGYSANGTEHTTFVLEGMDVFEASYNRKTGDFSCLYADYYTGEKEFEMDGTLTVTSDSIDVTVDDYNTEDSSAKLQLTISKGADMEEFSGPEFDIGTASEDDWNELLDDILGSLYDMF